MNNELNKPIRSKNHQFLLNQPRGAERNEFFFLPAKAVNCSAVQICLVRKNLEFFVFDSLDLPSCFQNI
jgi:hypothetical protein